MFTFWNALFFKISCYILSFRLTILYTYLCESFIQAGHGQSDKVLLGGKTHTHKFTIASHYKGKNRLRCDIIYDLFMLSLCSDVMSCLY